MTINNFCFYLQNGPIQNSQTGGRTVILPPLVFPAETITQITLDSITLMRLDPSWLIQAVSFYNVCREKGL